MRRDLIALPEASKVWIYQASKPIDEKSADAIKSHVYDFTMQWSSHGRELDCYGHLFHSRFLVFVTDESNHPSGCSIDASVHFVKSMEAQFNIDFFDRMQIAYIDNDEIKSLHKSELNGAYTSGKITDETLMFNNLVNTKADFLQGWIVPLSESWYMKWLS